MAAASRPRRHATSATRRKAIIDNLRSVGVPTIAASGNESSGSALSAPACISSAVSVGAVTELDQVASFSNSASFLTLLAPGVRILSSVPPDGFALISGTSQATPFVAGAFAILNQRLGRADVSAVLGALTPTGVPVRYPRNGLLKPRIAIDRALDALPVARSASGLQVTPDGARTLISKDVAGERWAITLDRDGTVTGNVFLPGGGEPAFVSCERVSDDGNRDPSAVLITFSCAGAGRCTSEPCTADAWTPLGEVTLPGSFFLPR